MTVPAFFEVHLWPHRGRLLLVRKQPQWDLPELTWLAVEATDSIEVPDAVVAVAYALGAGAGLDGPEALVVLHDRHGNMLASYGGLGLPTLVLRRARP